MLDRAETEQLARYKSERARGIVHTEEWQAKMAELQRLFDDKPWLTLAPGYLPKRGFARKLIRR